MVGLLGREADSVKGIRMRKKKLVRYEGRHYQLSFMSLSIDLRNELLKAHQILT